LSRWAPLIAPVLLTILRSVPRACGAFIANGSSLFLKDISMTLTIVGYGNVGSGLAKQFVKAGHSVTLTGRSLDKAQAVAEPLGAKVLRWPRQPRTSKSSCSPCLTTRPRPRSPRWAI
jgi:phosphoglycerate dehydrogenase-like enzyme